jgi:hypothetical protein
MADRKLGEHKKAINSASKIWLLGFHANTEFEYEMQFQPLIACTYKDR